MKKAPFNLTQIQTIGIGVIIIILGAWWVHSHKAKPVDVVPNTTVSQSGTTKPATTPTTTPSTVTNSAPTIKILNPTQKPENVDVPNLMMFSLKSGQEVSGKQRISGVINNGYFYDGTVGLNIISTDNTVLKSFHAKAVGTDWKTVDPVQFAVDVDFSQFPKGTAYIEIKNDNPSGLPKYDTPVLLQIVIK